MPLKRELNDSFGQPERELEAKAPLASWIRDLNSRRWRHDFQLLFYCLLSSLL